MNIQLFQQLANQLLQHHYGLILGDTRLTEAGYVAMLLENGVRPYEYLNTHAQDCDLDRIDLPTVYGVPSQAPLTIADEYSALVIVAPIHPMGEEPVCCPRCCARTAFDDLADGYSHHTCSNPGCGHEFIVEDEEGAAADVLASSDAAPVPPGSLYERLVAAFPGFLTGDEISGAELVDWVSEHLEALASIRANA